MKRMGLRSYSSVRSGFTLRQLLILTALTACTLALIRGCYIDAINAAKVRPGMTKTEVLAVMGRPAEQFDVPDGGEQWHYKRAGHLWQRRVIEFDDSGQVVRMYDD